MWNNKHIQKCKFTSNFSDLVIYHIRPIYNGKTLRYCYEENMFACSWVFCKQTAEPKEKACSGEASHIGEYQRTDSSYWVETSGYTLTDSHLDLRVQCWEPEALHLRHTPFIQMKQDYWNDRQVFNLGTRSWFRPIKLRVTESSQWRTAVRH